MTSIEWRTSISIALIFACRMLGLFMVLPVLSVYGAEVPGGTIGLIGLAVGIYGLTQAFLQIPFGLLSDIIGRKPVIVLGLVLFLIGSLMAAYSTDIYTLIIGRLLQGAGAIASTCLALLADISSLENRSKGMAIVGISIGASFVLALLIGPAIAPIFGLKGLFIISAVMAFSAIVVVFTVLPKEERKAKRRNKVFSLDIFKSQMNRSDLWVNNLGVFVLHLIMTSNFLAIPLILLNRHEIQVADHWKLYLPLFLTSLILMGPFLRKARQESLMLRIINISVITMIMSQLMFLLGASTMMVLLVAFILFFTAFNLLEAILPTMVSHLADMEFRGTAMGAYSSSQFLGAFAGGALGGFVWQLAQERGLFLFALTLLVLWLSVLYFFRPRQTEVGEVLEV